MSDDGCVRMHTPRPRKTDALGDVSPQAFVRLVDTVEDELGWRAGGLSRTEASVET